MKKALTTTLISIASIVLIVYICILTLFVEHNRSGFIKVDNKDVEHTYSKIIRKNIEAKWSLKNENGEIVTCLIDKLGNELLFIATNRFSRLSIKQLNIKIENEISIDDLSLYNSVNALELKGLDIDFKSELSLPKTLFLKLNKTSKIISQKQVNNWIQLELSFDKIAFSSREENNDLILESNSARKYHLLMKQYPEYLFLLLSFKDANLKLEDLIIQSN